LDWSRADNTATWYVDGVQVHKTTRGGNIPAAVWDAATNHGFYIILNIAMGGEMPANNGVPLNGATGGGGHYDAEYVAAWTGPANAPPPVPGNSTTPPTTPPTTGPTTRPPTSPPTTPPTTAPTTAPPSGTTWAAYTPYTVGQVVTYNGVRYQCRQSHTAYPGWEPPNVLALWLPI
jgi:beta-glucanase (GH16 family)